MQKKKCLSLRSEVKKKLGKLILNCNVECSPCTPKSSISNVDLWDSYSDVTSECSSEKEIPSILNLEKYLKRLILNPRMLELEFENLLQFDNNLSMKKGLFCIARKFPKKNRFMSVLANEYSRVRLSKDDSLYINANHVNGNIFNVKHNYVACQAPLPDCICEFWEMVYEQNSSIIVMLASEINESGKEFDDLDPFSDYQKRRRVDQYWPNENESIQYGNLIIESKSVNTFQNETLIIREFSIEKKGGDKHNIQMLHFYGWPDMGVPDMEPFLKLLNRINEYIYSNPQQGPIILHCLAGVGRTGTFAAIHLILTQVKNFLNDNFECNSKYFPFNIYKTVMELKRARVGMVQEQEQYFFIYSAIIEGCKKLGYNFHYDIPETDAEDDFMSFTSNKSSSGSMLNSIDSISSDNSQYSLQTDFCQMEDIQEDSDTQFSFHKPNSKSFLAMNTNSI